MGPKKKGKGKGNKGPVVVGGYTLTDMTPKELQDFAVMMQKEQERTFEERNFFQMECDKIKKFWEICKQELEEKNSLVRLKEKEIEELKQGLEIKKQELAIDDLIKEMKLENKQQIKHMKYEYDKNIADREVQAMANKRDADEEHQIEEDFFTAKIKDLDLEIKKQELATEELIKEIKLKHTEEMYNLTQRHDEKLNDTIVKYEKLMIALREESELEKRVEIHEVEESKNCVIKNFMDNHNEDFSRMQRYFKDLTLKNFAVISSLKGEIEAVKKNEEDMKQTLQATLKENNQLHHLKQESVTLNRKMVNYERDITSLALTRQRLDEALEKARKLEYENEVLAQRLHSATKLKEALYNQFVLALRRLQERTGLKNLFLEKRLDCCIEKLEDQKHELDSPATLRIVPEEFVDNSAPLAFPPKENSKDEPKKETSKPVQLPLKVVKLEFPDEVLFNPPQQLNSPGLDYGL